MVDPTEPNISSPFGTFFGADLDALACDALAIEHISRPLLAHENGLFQSKWFDYRDLHPTKATYLFAHEYRRAYRWQTARRLDLKKAEHVKGFRGSDIFKLSAGELLGFWKARQAADAIGCPYEFYLRHAFMWCDKRLWKRFPRPTQLYSVALIEHVIAEWEARCKSSIPVPLSSQFYADNYQGFPAQDQFHEWFCARIKANAGKDAYITVASYLTLTPVLTEEAVEKHLGADALARAKQFANEIFSQR